MRHGAQQHPQLGIYQVVGDIPWWLCFIYIVTRKLFVTGTIKLQIADF